MIENQGTYNMMSHWGKGVKHTELNKYTRYVDITDHISIENEYYLIGKMKTITDGLNKIITAKFTENSRYHSKTRNTHRRFDFEFGNQDFISYLDYIENKHLKPKYLV